jgi:hypothetical protein
MITQNLLKQLKVISERKGLESVKFLFNEIITELTTYLTIEPLYMNISIKWTEKEYKNGYILDFGVNRSIQDRSLAIEISSIPLKFLPFILLREAYYSFVDSNASHLVKICINQIVENNLHSLTAFREWKKLIRDSIIDKDFIYSELGRLQKFFKTEARAPSESVTPFFFKELRENRLLCQDNNITRFYDVIFEKYIHTTSRSMFDPEIIETLRILITLFYTTKTYQHLTEYYTQFAEHKEKNLFETFLSYNKFVENMSWINKCSPVAPSYDYLYNSVGFLAVMGIIKFHPLLERTTIRKLMEGWPFFYLSKIASNSFAVELSVTFHIPKIYLNDFLGYFNKLEEDHILVEKRLFSPLSKIDFVNLNYYLDFENTQKIISPSKSNYKKEYEIEFRMDYPPDSPEIPMSIFDYTILERGRSVSVTGLTFDKRIETLNAIIEDIENELRKELSFNQEFKTSFTKITNSPLLTQQFLAFLNSNQSKGFFYSYFELNEVIRSLELLGNLLDVYPEITNLHKYKKFINSRYDLHILEERILIQYSSFINRVLPIYFQSKRAFREEQEKFQTFYAIFDACYNFKIFNLTDIQRFIHNPHLIQMVYQTRKDKYDTIFKTVNRYKITNERIKSTIDSLLNHTPPVLKPMLINTILTNTFAKYYPEIILKDTKEAHDKIQKLKAYFPRIFIATMENLADHSHFVRLLVYCVNIREKEYFLSVLQSFFGDSLISFNRYFWGGLMRSVRFGARNFYDFEKGRFFYTEALYQQVRSYSQQIIDTQLKWSDLPSRKMVTRFFSEKGATMDGLIKTINRRILQQNVNFTLGDLHSLVEFRNNLRENIVDYETFLSYKESSFFKRYVKKISFIPLFQKFGMSQYSLYLRTLDTGNLDFKLLLLNSFQKITYPASIKSNSGMTITYMFPFRNPNKSYLNRLTKTKRIVSEYCLFYRKRLHDIVHFDQNLEHDGWHYSAIRFKSYLQNILFNPVYNSMPSGVIDIDLNTHPNSEIYGKGTKEFDILTDIYNTQSIDIKSILGTRQYSKISNITDLLKKKLLFPYISFQNLDLQNKVSLMLPNLTQRSKEKLIQIFTFFNMCRIYEIEGEFFLYGFEREIPFEEGLLIEIWFPECDISAFFEVFELLFHYLEVKHYLFLTDLVNGKQLVKSTYGNLDILNEYNPLKNLIWNEKDKKWMNHKLYTEKMEKVYPDLFYREED